MIAYFDDIQNGNCALLNDTVLFPLDTEFQKRLMAANFQIKSTETIDKPGIYILRTKEHAHIWSGIGEQSKIPQHILSYIPKNIIAAAKEGKIIICIDNQAEGFPLNSINGIDCFYFLHDAMRTLNLPQYSVMFIDSNYNFVDCYLKWCYNNDTVPMIAHCYFLTGFYYFTDRIPNIPLVRHAAFKEDSKDFNSFNRTVRSHRLQHLYWLIKNNYHNDNLVSGNYHNTANFDHKLEGLVLSQHTEKDIDLIYKNMPLIIDGDWTRDNPDDSDEAVFNLHVFKNSLLSFVTCTAFAQEGLFITEKLFKPIAAGHPFIVLAQKNALKYLRFLGYRTDFVDIDQTYDSIDDPIDRFNAAHQSLENWIKLSRDSKKRIISKNLEIIAYNQEHFRKQNYIQQSFRSLYSCAEEIINHKYSVYEKNKFCLS